MKYGEMSGDGLNVRRRDKRVWFVVLGMFVAVFLFTFLAQRFKDDEEVDAASLANFDPGYIISDYQMGRYDAMSEAEIQAFLTSKNACTNTDYNYYLRLSANTNYTWHFENGHFVCLSEELFGDGEVIGSGETAAKIIWQAAQDYRINPQVLIVLLQKETGLITDPIPNDKDYRKATGYGCPDTAACSSEYYGFKNQVRKAAELFRAVLDGGWTNYPLGENYVQYNPSAACGGTVVNIRSLATSALYRYTPYQPNAAALAAGYGYGDSCSAYGNRNFYLYFEDWFSGITMEASYVSLDSPRYFELIKETERINPYTGETIDILPAGIVRKYDSKIKMASGEWCLRTEYSTANNSDACIRLVDLKEIELKYEKIDEKKIIMPEAQKISMRNGREVMNFSEYLIRHFTKKTTFLGTTYYITEFDDNNNGAEYGIPEEYLLNSYEDFSMAEEYILRDDIDRVNPFTKEVYDRLEKGRIIKFAAEIEVEGKKYYQTEYNNKDNINAAILVNNLVSLDEYSYDPFINPREMILIMEVNRVNPFNGLVYDRLDAGRVIKFSSKIYVNGVLYYRTDSNTTNNINAAIPAWAIGEK